MIADENFEYQQESFVVAVNPGENHEISIVSSVGRRDDVVTPVLWTISISF